MMGWYCGTELPIQSDIIPMQVEIGYYVQSTDLPEPDTQVMVRHFLGGTSNEKSPSVYWKSFFQKSRLEISHFPALPVSCTLITGGGTSRVSFRPAFGSRISHRTPGSLSSNLTVP